MILVPVSSDVISAVAVVVRNVLFDSALMTVTTKGLRKTFEVLDSTKADDPLYVQRTSSAEALQVKVTVFPLHTSGPASLDRSTAAEAEGTNSLDGGVQHVKILSMLFDGIYKTSDKKYRLIHLAVLLKQECIMHLIWYL